MNCIYTLIAYKCCIYLGRSFCRFFSATTSIFVYKTVNFDFKKNLTPMSSFNENHQRCQGTCHQQDTTDTRGWASVTVVTLTTADVTFKHANFAFAGRVAVLGTSKTGYAIFDKQLDWTSFHVHLGASILTNRALYALRFTIGPWRSRDAKIALQMVTDQSWWLGNKNASISQSISRNAETNEQVNNPMDQRKFYIAQMLCALPL